MDVCDLNYDRLGKIAFRVSTAVGTCKRRRFLEKRVVGLLAKAVKQDRLKATDLKEKLRVRVELELSRQDS